MLKKIVWYIFFACSMHYTKPIEVVSLGETCSVAGALRTANIRAIAYPFDWVISEITSLCNAFEDDFNRFFQEDSLHLRKDQKAVIDYYGFEFLHDLPTIKPSVHDNNISEAPFGGGVLVPHWKEFISEARAKYLRRLQRLKDLLHGLEKIYFIRHFGMDREQAINFRDLLYRKYPNLNFMLIVVDRNHQADWDLKDIKYFQLNDSKVWNDPAQWNVIFKDLGLIT